MLRREKGQKQEIGKVCEKKKTDVKILNRKVRGDISAKTWRR